MSRLEHAANYGMIAIREGIDSVVSAMVEHRSRHHQSPLTDAVKGNYEAEVAFSQVWASCGLPLVIARPKLIACLAATRFSPSTVSDLVSPWPAFAIRIPDELGVVVRWLGVMQSAGNLFIGFSSDNQGFDGGLGCTSFADLCSDAHDYNCDESCTSDHSTHSRIILTLKRIVVGVVAEVQAHRPTGRGVSVAQWEYRKRLGKKPAFWRFALTRDVRVDCMAAVREHLAIGGRSPTVQSLVRGHWKSQACGARFEQRKLIHVEPYWRGPEDAPIAVRAHKLGRGSAS